MLALAHLPPIIRPCSYFAVVLINTEARTGWIEGYQCTQSS